MTRSLPADLQNNLKHSLGRGMPFSDISNRLGVSKGAISKYKKLWFADGKVNKAGRPAIISETTKSLLRRKVLIGELKTARSVRKELDDLGYRMTAQSAGNLLRSMGFYAAIKKKKPFLKKKNIEARYKWAKRHQHWTVEDWKKVIFSDETKVNVWGSDGCKYYWTRPGDKLQPHHLDLTVKHGNGSVMMWGCMTYKGPGYACQVFDGTMKSEDYQHILDTTYRETLKYYKMDISEWYFQDDNDPKHRSRSTKKWVKENNMLLLEDWPAQSPDLNPIEHLWHHLKIKLSMYEKKATSVHELWERIDKEWNSFTAEECLNYYHSMPDRIQAVIAAKGGHTRY
jgi:transposase